MSAPSAHWDSTGSNQLMTLLGTVGDASSSDRVVLFGLRNPTAGNKTFSVTWTTSSQCRIFGISFSGVSQVSDAAAFPNFNSASAPNGATNATPSVVITSAVGDMVVGVFGCPFNGLTSTNNTQLFANSTTVPGGMNRAAGAASVTISGTMSATDFWCVAGVSIAAATRVILNDYVLDNGLAGMDAVCDKIYICSQQPTTYTEAVTTFGLGNKNWGVGAAFANPAAGSPNGRSITSIAITDGRVTTNGTVEAWAAVDTANSRLLVSGNLTGGKAVTSSQTFTLGALTINIPNQ